MWRVPITSDLGGYQWFWVRALVGLFCAYCGFWLLMLYLWLRYR